jgi:putative SOS response-associated peptidase YedK
MCGRFVVAGSGVTDVLRDLLSEAPPGIDSQYNVAPTNRVPVVRSRTGHGNVNREMQLMHWGLVPPGKKSWTDRPMPINARLEGVATNRMFSHAYRSQRGVLPALGYYEWRVEADGSKQPFLIRPEGGEGMAMAGLWEAWPDPALPDHDPAKWRLSVTIITREARGRSGEVHDRMPVCLTPDGYDAWLDPDLSDVDQLRGVLDHESLEVAGTLSMYPVSKAVGNVRNSGPELIREIEI